MCGCCSGSPATPGHLHTELHRRLVDSNSIRADDSSASRCRSRSHERVGVKTKRKEKCASPVQRTTYPGMVWDSTTMQARLSLARIESILTAVKRVREGQSLTVKQFQKLLGLMAAASNVIPFGLLYMRPFAVVAQDQRVFPEGQPVSHDQGHAAMLTCLRHVEETVVPVTRPRVGGSVSSRNANDGRLPHGLGSGHEFLWEFLPDLRGHHVLVRTDNTSVVSYINRQGGLLYRLAHQILLWAQGKLLSLRAVYIPGHLNQGADILSRQGLRHWIHMFTDLPCGESRTNYLCATVLIRRVFLLTSRTSAGG